MSMKRRIIIIPCVFLAVSVCVNALLLKMNIDYYCLYKTVRVDPSNLFKYNELNKKISRKNENTIRIVLFGDSRIAQWDPVPDIPGCEIINRGVPGETTSQSLLRIDSDLLSLNPDIAVIQIGANDCNSIGTLPEFEVPIITNCRDNIKRITEILTSRNIRTVFLTIFPVGSVPVYRLPFWSEKTRSYISETNTMLSGYNSGNIRIVDCDPLFLENGKLKKTYAKDMLHLNRGAYMKLNDQVKPYIETYIAEMRRRN